MKILVTGHDGYIGPVMVDVLRRAGHSVVGLDTFYFRGYSFGAAAPSIPALVKDARDVEADDLTGFDAVVHLAALSNDPIGNLNPRLTHEINYEASVALAQAAKNAGVQRFVFSSSCSVYGTSNGEMLTEDAPVAPLTAYAESKVRTEESIGALADRSFSPVFLRNATAYGVSSKLRIDLVLNNLVGWAYAAGRVSIMSDGTPRRPLVHIEDISRVAAAVLCAPRDAIHNQIFNVGGNDENYQVRDLAEIVRQTVPNSTVEYAGAGGADQRDYWVDFSKLSRCLTGFTLRWNASAGARELYEAFQMNPVSVSDLERGSKYVRVRRLRQLMDTALLDENLRWRAE